MTKATKTDKPAARKKIAAKPVTAAAPKSRKKTSTAAAADRADKNKADISLDPAVVKLIEYAKEKKNLSYEELSDYLPEHIINSDKIEQVLALLEANNVQLI
ncbi:MAG: RNA polymerase sigma factor region1.1 domain-containing protein, partial [Treponema sp.]|nr:RNA polymerase sigma factor region1.1 domain-containing protein [Treponema sp.]